MSRFPRIDKSCPLNDELRSAIAGHCEHCDTYVHVLDDKTDDERRAILAAASGPICVKYQVPARQRLGRFGVAIAATLITSSAVTAAYAGESTQQGQPLLGASPTEASAVTQNAQGDGDEEWAEVERVTIMGAVNDPKDALSAEDTSVPALPMRDARDADVHEDQLERVVVVGGAVLDPADAHWVDVDDTLPALPMIAADQTDTGDDTPR